METGDGAHDGMGKFTRASRPTVDEVRKTKGFEHLTEDEATRYIDDLERFCLIIYKHFNRTNTGKHEHYGKAA